MEKVKRWKCSYKFSGPRLPEGIHKYIKVIDGEVENLSCTCDEYKETYSACRHVIAGVKEFVSNPNYVKIFGGKNESESVNDVAYSRKRVNKEDYKEYNQLFVKRSFRWIYWWRIY